MIRTASKWRTQLASMPASPASTWARRSANSWARKAGWWRQSHRMLVGTLPRPDDHKHGLDHLRGEGDGDAPDSTLEYDHIKPTGLSRLGTRGMTQPRA